MESMIQPERLTRTSTIPTSVTTGRTSFFGIIGEIEWLGAAVFLKFRGFCVNGLQLTGSDRDTFPNIVVV
jgi:hypothetical protein